MRIRNCEANERKKKKEKEKNELCIFNVVNQPTNQQQQIKMKQNNTTKQTFIDKSNEKREIGANN